jgi:hypothetical protein
MSTLNVGRRYQEPTVLIVPSTAGFPLVFKLAEPHSRCWLSTAFTLAMTVAALWTVTVPFASAAAAGSEYHISAARASRHS